MRALITWFATVTESVKSKIKLHHPDSEDLAFLYGTIVTDGKDAFSDQPTVNMTVFADKEVSQKLFVGNKLIHNSSEGP